MTLRAVLHVAPLASLPLPGMYELFKSRKRDNPSIMGALETNYAFLLRVDDPVFERVRQVFNQWFSRFAVEQGNEAAMDLKARFRSRRDFQFYGAFWELYLHETFARLGFRLDAHPETATGKRPDFEATRGDDHFYLEAVVPSPPGVQSDTSPGADQVIEYIDAVPSPHHYLAVRSAVGGPELPRKRQVQARVEAWLRELPEPSEAIHPGARNPTTTLEVGGWRIGLEATYSPGKNGLRSVGVHPAASGFPSAMADALRTPLEHKSTRYGDLGAPYIVAVWAMSPMSSPATLGQTLFGFDLEVCEGSFELRGTQTLSGRALWGRDSTARRRVSAILYAPSMDFNYSSMSRTMPRLWRNPWSDYPLTASLPVAEIAVDRDFERQINKPASSSPSKLVGLPSDWPGRPFQALRE